MQRLKKQKGINVSIESLALLVLVITGLILIKFF